MKKAIVMIAVAAIVSIAFFRAPFVQAATIEVASVNNRNYNLANGDINFYINSTVYKPSTISYSVDIAKQYLFNDLGNVQEWMFRNYHNFYEVNIDFTLKATNNVNALIVSGQDYVSVLPSITWNIAPICYAIEDLSGEFDIYSVWNGEIRYRPVSGDMIYDYKVAFPAKSASIIQFRVHAYYSYDSFSDIYGGQYYGTQFNTSTTYATVTDMTVPQPSTFTRIESVIAQKSNIFNFQKVFDGFNTTFDYLSNIYNQLRGNNESTGNINNQSNSLNQQTQQVHTQEQSYYQQNQQAIQSTGLSNYQFSNDQISGIGAVSNDFTSLWNALGSWNGVYIFSLTLNMALTILRHMPHGIRKKKDSTSGGSS